MSLLAVEGLEVRYGDFLALRGPSLAVEAGQAVAIVGANGAGKSTLLAAIAGLQPANRGRVLLDGVDITRMPAHVIARAGITLVPEGRRLFPSLTVEENLLMGMACRRIGPWSPEAVYRLFPALSGLRRQLASRLSGGQQQMVAIGRALLTNPRLLFCDEISLGLAPKVVDEVYACFASVRAAGVSLVLVEQNLTRARAEADYLYCLLEGRISLSGAPSAVSMAAVARAYFGTGDEAA